MLSGQAIFLFGKRFKDTFIVKLVGEIQILGIPCYGIQIG
jgi:hypothetical protein